LFIRFFIILPAPVLAKISLDGQKETGTADRARRAKILFSRGNPLQIPGFDAFGSGIFPAGIAAAKGAHVPITARQSWRPCAARGSRTEVELRRDAGRSGWPGKTQLQNTMNQL
jgi:hypothetical protein